MTKAKNPRGMNGHHRHEAMKPADRLIRMDEVLKRVPVSASTIYKLMVKHQFPRAHKAGHVYVWPESVIDRYVAGTWKPGEGDARADVP